MPGSTANLGLPYPILTDPADIETFGVKPLADALELKLAGPSIIREGHAWSNSGFGSATFVFIDGTNGLGQNGAFELAADTPAARSVFHLNPADYPSSAKLRLSAVALVNGTAPATTYVYGLYPVTATGGAANASNITLGTVIATTATITTPAANSENHQNSAKFAIPTAGFYALGMARAGTEANNSYVTHCLTLQSFVA
jgi:hypothetical protein